MAQRLVRGVDLDQRGLTIPDEASGAQLQTVIDTAAQCWAAGCLMTMRRYMAQSKLPKTPLATKAKWRCASGATGKPRHQSYRLPANGVTSDMLEAKASKRVCGHETGRSILKALKGITTIEEVYRVVG